MPTLEVGDRVLVNKLSYDLHDVNRGDIVVFEAEPNPDWRDARHQRPREARHRAAGRDDRRSVEPNRRSASTAGCSNESYLPKGTTTDLFHGIDDDANQPEDIVPGARPTARRVAARCLPGQYFVMGDNRSESADARDHGPIKGSSIVGRVFVRIWPPGRLGFL